MAGSDDATNREWFKGSGTHVRRSGSNTRIYRSSVTNPGISSFESSRLPRLPIEIVDLKHPASINKSEKITPRLNLPSFQVVAC